MKRFSLLLIILAAVSAPSFVVTPVHAQREARFINDVTETVDRYSLVPFRRLRDGRTVVVARYSSDHTVGDGSGQTLQYDASSTATIDGGFVFAGRLALGDIANYQGDWDNATAYTTGQIVWRYGQVYEATAGTTGDDPTTLTNWAVKATTGRLIAVDQSETSLLRFGAIGNSDLVFRRAVEAAAGKPVVIDHSFTVSGSNYTYTGDMTLVQRDDNVLVTMDNAYLFCIGQARLDGLRFTGTADRVFMIAGAGHSSFTRCHFESLHSETSFNGGIVTNTYDGTVTIDQCVFKDLTALADNVIGSGGGGGTCRGVWCSQQGRIRISDCVFDTIHTVDGNGDPVFEDADAIAAQHMNGSDQQTLTVTGCTFRDCGKRCVKCQGDAAQGDHYEIVGNTCEAGWSGTGDLVSDTDNGMESFVSALGGDVTVASNTLTGGACASFVDVTTIGPRTINRITVKGNTCDPEKHNYVMGGYTKGIKLATPTGFRPVVTVSDNFFRGFFRTINVSGECDLHMENNQIYSNEGAMSVIADATLTCTGNTFQQDQRYPLSGPYAIYLSSGVTRAIINDNLISDYGDGVYLDDSAEPNRIVARDNTMRNISRYPIVNFNSVALPVFDYSYHLDGVYYDNGVSKHIGDGTPEGVVSATVGSEFKRRDGGAGTTLYIKESGTGNTGWVAK